LAQTRETFRAMASGDPAAAMQAAKQIKDGTERETALLTLVTEWTQGNLHSPQARAAAISEFGLEAGPGNGIGWQPSTCCRMGERVDARSRPERGFGGGGGYDGWFRPGIGLCLGGAGA